MPGSVASSLSLSIHTQCRGLLSGGAEEVRGGFALNNTRKRGKKERREAETTTQPQNGSPLQEQILLETGDSEEAAGTVQEHCFQHTEIEGESFF